MMTIESCYSIWAEGDGQRRPWKAVQEAMDNDSSKHYYDNPVFVFIAIWTCDSKANNRQLQQ